MKLIKKIRLKKTRRLALISWFRVLLWWGSEIARDVFTVKRSAPQIQHVTKDFIFFPLSSWMFSEDKLFCLSCNIKEKKIEIHSFAINKN